MNNKIINTVSEVLGVEVNDNTSQKNCDKWNSLRHLNIIIALENTFDVTFEPEEIAEMKSVKDIEILLKSKLE